MDTTPPPVCITYQDALVLGFISCETYYNNRLKDERWWLRNYLVPYATFEGQLHKRLLQSTLGHVMGLMSRQPLPMDEVKMMLYTITRYYTALFMPHPSLVKKDGTMKHFLMIPKDRKNSKISSFPNPDYPSSWYLHPNEETEDESDHALSA